MICVHCNAEDKIFNDICVKCCWNQITNTPATESEYREAVEKDQNHVDPYSAQVLRKIYSDKTQALQEYDLLLPHLKHRKIKKYLKQELASLVKKIDIIENLFILYHPNLPRLDHQIPEDDQNQSDKQVFTKEDQQES